MIDPQTLLTYCAIVLGFVFIPGPATLVECRLETGRTHQIRIHLSESGHPVLGERVYCRHRAQVASLAPRQMLHAAHLAFRHPGDQGELEFDCPPPDDMRTLLERLRRE